MKIYMVSLLHRATIKETTGQKYNVRICYAGRPRLWKMKQRCC